MSDWKPNSNDGELVQNLSPGKTNENPESEHVDEPSQQSGESCDCPTEGGVFCATGSGPGFWNKIPVCIIIMVIAIGVGLYSMFSDETAKAGSTDDQIETEGESQNAWVFLVESIGEQVQLDEDTEVIFILLSGEDEASNADAADGIETLADSLAGLGKNVQAVTLEIDADCYDELVSEFSVETFPGVLVSVKDFQTLLVTSDITGDTLLSTYVEASKADPACTDGSGEGSDCC